jgi:hypothetical protein
LTGKSLIAGAICTGAGLAITLLSTPLLIAPIAKTLGADAATIVLLLGKYVSTPILVVGAVLLLIASRRLRILRWYIGIAATLTIIETVLLRMTEASALAVLTIVASFLYDSDELPEGTGRALMKAIIALASLSALVTLAFAAILIWRFIRT